LSPPAPPVAGNCSLGSLSAYYVVASADTHIRATLAFVRKYNIRLSIKNSGHDYMGRSVAANSLALWTRNLKTMQYVKNFSASNCPAANTNDIGIIGAGVNAAEAENYFPALGFDVTVGANPTVGLAGGFGQGGGHGIFAPSYGLMVDQAVEFDVITADGSSKTINQCNDPDLFWAMRGGGGSTYAVLTSYKFKVHPIQMISQYRFTASVEPSAQVADITKSPVFRGLFTALVAGQSAWSANNVTGNYFIGPDFVDMFFILPTNLPLDHLKNLTAKFNTVVSNLPGLNITTNSYAQYPRAQVGGGGQGDTPAFSVVAAGRLIPSYLFQTHSAVLVQTMLQAMANAGQLNFPQAPIQMQIYASTPANHPNGSATGVNPAWRGSLWHLLMVTGYVQGSPQELVDSFWEYARLGAKPFIDLLPGGGGCYMNEADYGEENWQNAFFGSNYPRLLAIKQRYDPTGLFNCWKCVGWSPSE
jgi:FAD/FMN-containing dehydrogenase